MSKKLYSTNKWKRYLRSRQESELRSKKRRPRGRSGPKYTAERIARRKYHILAAPQVFSIIKNPEGSLPFLREIDFYSSKNYNLSFDLSGVTEITTDAIAALVATIDRLAVYARGNLPVNEKAQRILVESGFFDHMRRRNTEPLPPKRGTISREKQSKKVQGDVARDLIRFGTNAVFGGPQQSKASYRVMVESMSNTHNHAAGKYQTMTEKWWGTAFADSKRNCVCFTFLDTGIGIFRSVRLKTLRGMYRRLGFGSDAVILRDMLRGEVGSSTGEPYRGKGLPAIYELSRHGSIKSLVIVSNDVYADVGSEEYRMLTTEFKGTLLYWEITKGGLS